MKTATVRNRSTMCCCKVWFLHNEIIAPDVSINMLCICRLIGKWFLVELQAEGVLTEEQGCLWGQHFEEKVLKRTSEVKMRCRKMTGHRFIAHQHRISEKHAFKLYMYIRYIFGVRKKWRGGVVWIQNSKTLDECVEPTYQLGTWYEIQMVTTNPIPQTGFSVFEIGAQSESFSNKKQAHIRPWHQCHRKHQQASLP